MSSVAGCEKKEAAQAGANVEKRDAAQMGVNAGEK